MHPASLQRDLLQVQCHPLVGTYFIYVRISKFGTHNITTYLYDKKTVVIMWFRLFFCIFDNKHPDDEEVIVTTD